MKDPKPPLVVYVKEKKLFVQKVDSSLEAVVVSVPRGECGGVVALRLFADLRTSPASARPPRPPALSFSNARAPIVGSSNRRMVRPHP